MSIKESMKTRQLVTQFLKANYSTTKAKELEDAAGVRIKVLSESRVELATTYFYESQNHTASLYKQFETFADTKGVQVSTELPDHPVNNLIDFRYKPWPKTSWATLIVNLQEA